MKCKSCLMSNPLLTLVSAAVLFFQTHHCVHADVLVGDRLSNRVYRYSDNGVLLNTVVSDNTNLNQPSGIVISPDGSHIYVSNSQSNSIVRYDYNRFTGTATNASIFADAADGLSFPGAMLFSQDGSTLYASNLGGTGVSKFDLSGNANAPINGLVGGGTVFQYSGLAFAPDGSLLVGGFQDVPAGAQGAVAKSDASITAISDFIGPSASLNGASGLLVNGNDLYVTSMFAGNIQRFNATTGALDATFSVSGLGFPQSILLAPDGNSLLVGILGFVNGSGEIARYGLDGSLLGTFAAAGGSGFTEATSIAYIAAVPEPSTLAISTLALAYMPIRRYMRRNRKVLASTIQ